MHAWLSFLTGALAVIEAFLFFSALSGTTYYGIAIQIEETLAVTLLIIAAITAWIIYAGIRAQYSRIKTGKEALIGAKGIATTDLKPNGEVRVMGEFWQATAKDATIENGQAVEVVGMEGMFLVVKKVEEKA
jgi:membrane-bound ClpP family serine protease